MHLHVTCFMGVFSLHHIASLQDPIDPCSNVSGDITQYQIRFQTESFVDTINVTIAGCVNGRCSHLFMPNLSSFGSVHVSVAAQNVVGVGAAKNCTTQTIRKCPKKTC